MYLVVECIGLWNCWCSERLLDSSTVGTRSRRSQLSLKVSVSAHLCQHGTVYSEYSHCSGYGTVLWWLGLVISYWLMKLSMFLWFSGHWIFHLKKEPSSQPSLVFSLGCLVGALFMSWSLLDIGFASLTAPFLPSVVRLQCVAAQFVFNLLS